MKVKKLISFMLSLFIIFPLLTVTAGADSKKENIVRVGYPIYRGYQEGLEGESKSGSAYEYLQKIRYYTGWEYEYVYGDTDDLLVQLEKGEIDVMAIVTHSEERENYLYFSDEPQGFESFYVYTKLKNETVTEDTTSFNGKKFGILKDYSKIDYFRQWKKTDRVFCDIEVYRTREDMYKALEKDMIDGTIDIRLEFDSEKNIQLKPVYRFPSQALYFAVTKSRPDIIKEINRVQKRILTNNELYAYELMEKYHVVQAKNNTYLTGMQKEITENQKPLKVGYLKDFHPISITEKGTGNFSGIASIYFEYIEEKYGLEFEYLPYNSEMSMQYALLNKEIDIMLPIGYGMWMAEQLDIALSAPISTPTMSMFCKEIISMDKIETVAVREDSVTPREYVKKFCPNAKIVFASSKEDALKLVAEGKVDCYFVMSNSIPQIESTYRWAQKLNVVALPDDFEYSMAMRIEDVGVLSIINNAISTIPQSEVIDATAKFVYSQNEISLVDAIKDNPISVAAIIITSFSLFVVIFVLYKLKSDSAYLKQLQVARDEARRAQRRAERAQQRAMQASNAKSSFMTSMSHDIRTPMNAIIGMTTLATKHLDNPDYIKNCLNKVTLASNHLLTLINDVLDINKIETGKLSLNPTVFSLAESFTNITNISRPQIRAKKHRFEIRIHGMKHEYVFADELRINQIFINILANAVKYTPDNGHITVDVKQSLVPEKENMVRLVYIVEDNGVGMSEEFQKEMYTPFAQENRNVNLYGSGVGLTICKQLVDLMGGSIICESRLGEGTKFTVTLDLPIAEKVVEETMLPPMKILLVDDDIIFLETAGETLKDMGVTADCAESGQQAIEIVKEKHKEQKDYPVIIIDWKMPGMDGIETTRQIRRLIGPQVSIIVISAYDSDEIREKAIEAGANGFISKPFFRSSVYRSMTEILNIKTGVTDVEENPYSRLKGMNILVAEDNELNWEIAKELLAIYGISTTRGENGKKCVDIIKDSRRGEYDMILMDIQMPVINGYEATRLIRKIDREEIRNIPIIAMTANAFSEDVSACLEAGMNAHVAKPIDMEQLLEVIDRVRKEGRS